MATDLVDKVNEVHRLTGGYTTERLCSQEDRRRVLIAMRAVFARLRAWDCPSARECSAYRAAPDQDNYYSMPMPTPLPPCWTPAINPLNKYEFRNYVFVSEEEEAAALRGW